MHDKQIRLKTILAALLWFTGALVILLAILDQLNGVAPAGLALIIGGCMVDLHAMFADIRRREIKAFELGRRLTALRERDSL